METTNKKKFTKVKVAFLNQNQYGQYWQAPKTPDDANPEQIMELLSHGAKFLVTSYEARDGSGKRVVLLTLVPGHEIQASEEAYQARKKSASSSTLDI